MAQSVACLSAGQGVTSSTPSTGHLTFMEIYHEISWHSGSNGRVFTFWLESCGSIPGQVIPKTYPKNGTVCSALIKVELIIRTGKPSVSIM